MTRSSASGGPLKRRRPYPARSPLKEAAVRTGEHCPESGWWYPAQPGLANGSLASASVAKFVGEGSVMPAMGGIPAIWLRCEEQTSLVCPRNSVIDQ